jgi:hypothetical protein
MSFELKTMVKALSLESKKKRRYKADGYNRLPIEEHRVRLAGRGPKISRGQPRESLQGLQPVLGEIFCKRQVQFRALLTFEV